MVLVLGVTFWALLGWAAVGTGAPERLQARISTDTESALAAAGIQDIEVRSDGRSVTLIGRVGSEALRDSILALAREVRGVRPPIADRIVLQAMEPQPAPESAETAVARACQERFDAALAATPIRFEGGTSRVRQDSYPVLASLAETARTCPAVRFTIEGHTDALGPDDVNQVVSEARAQAVADYLIGAGIAAPRIVVFGLGESRPLETNATAAGRAANRRIELVVNGLSPSA